jgi:transposase
VDASADWSVMTEIEIIGLDEIALKKGHCDHLTLVTERVRDGEIMVLGVLPGHEKVEVIKFLHLIPPQIAQTVQTVCCGLWEAYAVTVREELRSTRIAADRFHVTRNYRHAADEVRKQELQRLKKELLKEGHKKT